MSILPSKLTNRLSKRLPHGMRRSRVLARNDLPADDDLYAPRLVGLDVAAADALNLVLEQGRHGGRQAHGFLLGVAEARGLVNPEEGAATAAEGDVDEDDGAVADGGDGLAGFVEFADEELGGLVVGEVEHGAWRLVTRCTKVDQGEGGTVSSWVEDGVKLGGLAQELL